MRRHRLALPLLVLLAACSGEPFAVENGDLRIRADGRSVHLTNLTSEPVYYHLVVHPPSPLYDWWPCTDPQACEGVAPGQRASVPYAAINEFRGGAREALLTWWFLEPGDGEGHRVARMDHVVIEL